MDLIRPLTYSNAFVLIFQLGLDKACYWARTTFNGLSN